MINILRKICIPKYLYLSGIIVIYYNLYSLYYIAHDIRVIIMQNEQMIMTNNNIYKLLIKESSIDKSNMIEDDVIEDDVIEDDVIEDDVIEDDVIEDDVIEDDYDYINKFPIEHSNWLSIFIKNMKTS
jgi:hypothetical protein